MASTDYLKAYRFHGMELTEEEQAKGDCPLCDKENHFYLTATTGQWQCHRCGEQGNLYTFLAKLLAHSQETTQQEDYESLSEDKGIPVETLKEWGLAVNLINQEWIIPAYNTKGNLANLYKYTSIEGEMRALSTPGCKLHPFGTQLLPDECKRIYWCEGPWDAMALHSTLSRYADRGSRFAKINNRTKAMVATQAVVAVPGATSFKPEWLEYAEGRDNYLLFDNDKAGSKGMDTAIKNISSNGHAPKSLRRILWGKSGYSKDLPSGYDIRDLIRDKGSVDALRFILAKSKPVDLAKIKKHHAKEGDESDSDGELSVTRYSDIQPEEVRWLVADRHPLGKINNLDGDPGNGKTFYACYLIACVTTGRPFPDGSAVMQGDAVIFTSEDGAADTLRPRLDLLKADPTKVHHVNCIQDGDKEDEFSFAKHISQLDAFLTSHPDVRLLVFDPLQAYMGAKTDTHKNSDVRRILSPLTRLADKHRICILCINHLNKGIGKSVYRGQGSIAFNAVARAVWQIAVDQNEPERRLVLPVKMNLAKTTGLAFRITDDGLEFEEGTIDMTADQAERRQHEDAPQLSKAKRWLAETLADGESPSRVLYARSEREGISKRTLDSAKKQLGIKSSKRGSKWFWRLSGSTAKETHYNAEKIISQIIRMAG